MRSAQEIGEMLRRVREEKGLSPEEVQAETKIRLRYLQALESGDESVIPGEVYYKGFLRFYANHLGLDGHALVEEYKQWKDSQRTEEERAAAAAQTGARGTAQSAQARRHIGVYALVGLAVIVAAVGIWGLLSYGRQRTAGGGAAPPPPAVVPGETGGSGAAPGGSPAGSEPAAPAVEVVKEDLGPAGLRYRATGSTIKVEVEALRLCWVRVTADGSVIFENALVPGAKAVWEAKQRLVVLYGNVGGVKFSVNGVPQEIAGRDGEVRTITYEPK